MWSQTLLQSGGEANVKLVNKGTYQVLTSEICEKGEIGMPLALNCQVLANTATSASFVRVCTVCV